MESRNRQAGLCWDCDYPLAGIESGRCPECGRGFDAEDERTVNLGKALGRGGRGMLRPVGRGILVGAAVAALMILVTARWPAHWGQRWLVDVPYFLRWG